MRMVQLIHHTALGTQQVPGTVLNPGVIAVIETDPILAPLNLTIL